MVRWVRLGETRLLDPFYEQTMQRVMMQPFHQLFRQEVWGGDDGGMDGGGSDGAVGGVDFSYVAVWVYVDGADAGGE